MSHRYGRFTYDAWTHPETVSIISKIAGVELVPQFDYEIGHINFSVKTKQPDERLQLDSDKTGTSSGQEIPVVGWHRDSYPFVCVLMLSDCSNMVGGETVLRTADGKIIRVQRPELVCHVIDGSYEASLILELQSKGHC
jgi:hypothetical protein